MNKAASMSLKSCLFVKTEQTESLSKPVSAQTIRRTLHQMKLSNTDLDRFVNNIWEK